MFTEELKQRIAVANERAKELKYTSTTHNIRTGATYQYKPRPPPLEPRYFVNGKDYRSIKEIQEVMGLRTHHDVHFRLSSKTEKWKGWGYIRDRDK